MKYSDEVGSKISSMWLDDYSIKEISNILDIPLRTTYNWLKKYNNENGINLEKEQEVEYQVVLDTNRVNNKNDKKEIRSKGNLLELHKELIDVISNKSFKIVNKINVSKKSEVGIVQLSDIHFNEIIEDIVSHKFDFGVASQRLQKFADKIKKIFNGIGITEIVVCMTGDLLNSDRRLEEITAAATNRSKAIFIAVDILQQFLLDLNELFNIHVVSVTGNESRVGEHIHYGDMLAGDSYDIVIHNILSLLFKNNSNIIFQKVSNPLEQVINVNDSNILILHGHAHGRIASNPHQQVHTLKSKYSRLGVRIDYVLFGHIHSAMISDNFSRSSGLPGNNAYSERALNLDGKSSQNAFIIGVNQEITGLKIDLQNVDGYNGYNFDKDMLVIAKKETPLSVYQLFPKTKD